MVSTNNAVELDGLKSLVYGKQNNELDKINGIENVQRLVNNQTEIANNMLSNSGITSEEVEILPNIKQLTIPKGINSDINKHVEIISNYFNVSHIVFSPLKILQTDSNALFDRNEKILYVDNRFIQNPLQKHSFFHEVAHSIEDFLLEKKIFTIFSIRVYPGNKFRDIDNPYNREFVYGEILSFFVEMISLVKDVNKVLEENKTSEEIINNLIDRHKTLTSLLQMTKEVISDFISIIAKKQPVGIRFHDKRATFLLFESKNKCAVEIPDNINNLINLKPSNDDNNFPFSDRILNTNIKPVLDYLESVNADFINILNLFHKCYSKFQNLCKMNKIREAIVYYQNNISTFLPKITNPLLHNLIPKEGLQDDIKNIISKYVEVKH